MPRQVRIEYAGAFYHVMARGNRKGDIVFDDEDRKTFLRTLGEVCKRAGFRIHAYALMSNHYHLLLETPQANLTAGMGWFQNAYTRRKLGVSVHFLSFFLIQISSACLEPFSRSTIKP